MLTVEIEDDCGQEAFEIVPEGGVSYQDLQNLIFWQKQNTCPGGSMQDDGKSAGKATWRLFEALRELNSPQNEVCLVVDTECLQETGHNLSYVTPQGVELILEAETENDFTNLIRAKGINVPVRVDGRDLALARRAIKQVLD